MAETRDIRLTGEIELDGAAFGGHVRPANLREDRVGANPGEKLVSGIGLMI